MILRAFLVAAAFINATPSLEQLCPRLVAHEPIEDEIVGSGREIAAEPLRLHTAKRPGGRMGDRASLRTSRSPALLAIRAINAATLEIARQDPALGQLLATKVPRVCRDDAVGTIVWSDADGAIRFNRSYVMSLSPAELSEHLLQLAAALDGPW